MLGRVVPPSWLSGIAGTACLQSRTCTLPQLQFECGPRRPKQLVIPLLVCVLLL
jgi:hypothetical protein